jgi:xanthine dehydrogenase molybdenum-binding subunit
VDRQDFANAPEAAADGAGADEWSYGDLDAGFKSARIVVDETFVVQSTGHQPMESRSAMAYWQNGKLYLHGSTQSVAARSIRWRAGSASTRRTSC